MMPLIAESFIDAEGNQKISVWVNGKRNVVNPPFLPYCYATIDLKDSFPDTEYEEKIENLTVLPISKLSPVNANKYIFKNTEYIKALNKVVEQSTNERHIFENHTRYLYRIRIDKPEWFAQYQQTEPLKMFYFDLETYTKNGIPTNVVISVAICFDGKYYYKSSHNERKLLKFFVDKIKEFDPDVLVGYNIIGYDLPLILSRMNKHKMDTRDLSRDETKPHFWKRDQDYRGVIGGRMIFDVWEKVDADQQLDDGSLKDHTLGSIAKYFGFDFQDKVDVTNTYKFINTRALKHTNIQDVRATRMLCDIYLPTTIELAEYMKIPLDSANHIGEVELWGTLLATDLRRSLIVSDGPNKLRHDDIFIRPKVNYQAALVFIAEKGLQENIQKVDFRGMYSSVEIAFNLSPETCRIVGYADYEDVLPKIAQAKDGKMLLGIPDNIIKKIVLIEVDMTKMGYLKNRLIEIRFKRGKLKDKYNKEEEPKKKARLKSRQGAYKLLLNLPSGVNGNPRMYYGDVAVTIATVGIARLLITYINTLIKKFGGKTVEIDTDGIYYTGCIPLSKFEAELKRVLATWGISETMELEQEDYPKGYFVGMKNYILLKLDGKLLVKGSSLKGTHRAPLFDKIVSKIAYAVFGSKALKWRSLTDISGCSIGDLTLRTKMNMAPEDYANQNCKEMQLYRQAKDFGLDPIPGTQFRYVKCKSGYKLAHMAKRDDIDDKYYKGMVNKILKAFGGDPTVITIDKCCKDVNGKQLYEYM